MFHEKEMIDRQKLIHGQIGLKNTEITKDK